MLQHWAECSTDPTVDHSLIDAFAPVRRNQQCLIVAHNALGTTNTCYVQVQSYCTGQAAGSTGSNAGGG
jgi:hypothetical protein|eukprot:COSAG02_NODE_4325_length_5498_cov_13.427857_4_plen_69_part_00